MIEVKDLHKSFGKQNVLDGIDLSVADGETLSLLGRSGTGKSVFLKLLIGLQKPDQGTIQIYGQEVPKLQNEELKALRKKIGFLFQGAALYDSLTIEQNVEFPLSKHTDLSAADRKKKAKELLASVGMEKDLEKMPSEISGGMQKRVGLARALALDPEILLLDEPTAGLDPVTANEIGALICELKQNHKTTSVVVTHDIAVARTFSDRMVLVDKGHIVVEGSFEDLKKSEDPFVVQFLKNIA